MWITQCICLPQEKNVKQDQSYCLLPFSIVGRDAENQVFLNILGGDVNPIVVLSMKGWCKIPWFWCYHSLTALDFIC